MKSVSFVAQAALITFDGITDSPGPLAELRFIISLSEYFSKESLINVNIAVTPT